MKPALAALTLVLTLNSCEKAKQLAEKASSAVKEKVAAPSATSSTPPDPELQKLVDQSPDGAIFQASLPFPSRLEVKTTTRQEISARITQSSAIEQRADRVTGTRTSVFKLERAQNYVRYTPEPPIFTIPTPDSSKEPPKTISDPLQTSTQKPRPVTFEKSGNSWKPVEKGNFHTIVLAEKLAPIFDDLLIENSLAPRPQWFAKRRIKPGDQIPVDANSLPMLLSGGAKGHLTLTLESFDAVDGHPCGVFSITGDYSRKKFPDFDGNLIDQEVTIQSGKIWLSLIHPIILREELNTIQSFQSSPGSGPSIHGQGSFKTSVQRTWKALNS